MLAGPKCLDEGWCHVPIGWLQPRCGSSDNYEMGEIYEMSFIRAFSVFRSLNDLSKIKKTAYFGILQ